MLITGRIVAEKILESTAELIEKNTLTPGLGVILVGDDAPSHLYVGIKEKKAEELGIHFEKKVFPTNVSEEEIQTVIRNMNEDSKIHGMIVQLPLPEHLDVERIIETISPNKDTDGFHPETIEKFLAGDRERLPVFPRAMLELVKMNRKESAENVNALAIVNSELMRRVLTRALEQEGFKTQGFLSHQKEKIENALTESSVILTAVGKPGIVSALEAKPGALFVDGGIYYDKEENVIGDVKRDDGVYREDILVTTVPGGVGPVTVAVLLARVTEAALRG